MIDDSDLARIWDGMADEWVAQVRSGEDRYRDVFNNPMFRAFLPDLQALDVIDLGCGEGYNTRLLARRDVKMTGIDISPRMIDAARAAEAAEPLGIAYRVGSFLDLEGLADASFDAAVSTMALMDSPGFDKAAGAAFRVLRPGGTFCFSVLHPCFWTPGYRWLRGPDGAEEGLMVANYFADRTFMEEWTLKASNRRDVRPFSTPRFPLRLEAYVNGLCDAGFQIRRMMEPKPTLAMVADHPWLDRMRRHAPLFLYVCAAKP